MEPEIQGFTFLTSSLSLDCVLKEMTVMDSVGYSNLVQK